MARRYRITFEQVSVSAAQDLIQVKGAAGKTCKIVKQWAGATDTSAPASQQLSFRGRFLPATVTDGGGTAVTPQKLDPGDAAASITAIRNSTSKATTNGTAVVVEENGAFVLSGYEAAIGASSGLRSPTSLNCCQPQARPWGCLAVWK